MFAILCNFPSATWPLSLKSIHKATLFRANKTICQKIYSSKGKKKKGDSQKARDGEGEIDPSKSRYPSAIQPQTHIVSSPSPFSTFVRDCQEGQQRHPAITSLFVLVSVGWLHVKARGYPIESRSFTFTSFWFRWEWADFCTMDSSLLSRGGVFEFENHKIPNSALNFYPFFLFAPPPNLWTLNLLLYIFSSSQQ